MKFLFSLLLIAAAGWFGWHSYPGIHAKLEARRAENARVREIVENAGNSAGGEKKGTQKTGSAAAEMLANLKKGGAGQGGETVSKPPVKAAVPGGEMAATPAETPPDGGADDIDSRYPLPDFATIEDITKEWSKIPSRAFPRKVKTLVSVNFEGPSGKSSLPENSEALAVGMTQGMLVLMKDRTDPARTLVPLANTDLKDTMTALYDKYKEYKVKQVEQQRARARHLKARANGATDAELAAAGPKPKTGVGGVITAMLESLRAKEITETKEESITAWGGLNVEEFEGKSYWTGTIQCSVNNAIFGPTPTELLALIRDDKVVKWLYSGSKEPVQ